MARRFFKHLLSSDSDNPACSKLLALAYRMTDASSNIEDKLLDEEIIAFCNSELERGEDSTIEATLGLLKDEEGTSHDDLLALAEGCAEFFTDKHGAHLLVLIPILAWSRYKIIFGKMPEKTAASIANLYKTYFAGTESRITIGNTLIASEHLPERLCDVRHLLEKLCTKKKQAGVVDTSYLLSSDPPADFSDVRYITLAASAPDAKSLFADFSAERIKRARAFMEFALRVQEELREFATGSCIEVQFPSAFFTAWRQASLAMRLYSLKSLVNYVCLENTTSADLVATTAIFSVVSNEKQQEMQPELRIGISLKSERNKIVAGVVWPCDPQELEIAQSFAGEVLALEGIDTIFAHEQLFPMEWCEQCGAPLYANPDGLVTHIEKPDTQHNGFAPTLN